MRRRVTAIAIISSIILVFLSTYLPTTVFSQVELASVKFDLPFPFIVQNQAYYPPFFPWQTRISSLWKYPVQIYFHVFFIDAVII
ncbi:hypothetical protein [Chroococcidiopsis sp. TS-821]|uniref:hypothetical protein n=1 Tax=Chroococcidiopsis sp. TS-821 TaxID=1378066 RepID=UPI000CEDBC28|nr:hypothetical protein [Chroococcidiopsis sp. TS-821]PPS46025.1 hypothetical protein B1A85_07370 [Chroococcidiopsis sp. TS-821]